MKYVGVDVAKNVHYARVASQNNKILPGPFAFNNDMDGFNKFVGAFRKFPKSDIIVGLESTGVYGENLIAFLSEQGYKIALINPIETVAVRRRPSRRR